MSKQVHVRMDDSLYEALSEYTGSTGQSVQDCISGAIMQMLGRQKMKQLRIMRNLHLLICLLESAECVSHSNRRAVTVSIPTNGTSTVSKHTLPTSEISLTATSRRLTQVLSLITISSWQAFRASRSLLRAFPRSRVSDVQQALRTRRRGRCSLTSAVF